MNIQEAKEQIIKTVKAYREKDRYGKPVIPLERQRPLFLIGAPGIGKTAVVAQAAKGLGINLVSYSMTHHTRQSALGLPFICVKEFGGKETRVTEYTMSEIIAECWKKMEESGVREGILFLDEINCVSETLAPAMLQFLQYKVFGQHRVPDGWVVVTAGNPPEYNQSVREFDMVTWDRLKRIDIEPDYPSWKKWAVNAGVHPAVLSFLDLRHEDFYEVEMTASGRSFVTPRGWVDLSDMMKLYDRMSETVDGLLVQQYLQNDRIAKQFASFCALWYKYRQNYDIRSILEGTWDDSMCRHAQEAPFDEKITLSGLLLDGLREDMEPVLHERAVLKRLLSEWKSLDPSSPVSGQISQKIRRKKEELEKTAGAGLLSQDAEYEERDLMIEMEQAETVTEFSRLQTLFAAKKDALKQKASKCSEELEHLFAFAEKAFDEQILLVIVTELTASDITASFIAIYGSPSYYRWNEELLFDEREKKIEQQMDELEP